MVLNTTWSAFVYVHFPNFALLEAAAIIPFSFDLPQVRAFLCRSHKLVAMIWNPGDLAKIENLSARLLCH